MFDTVRCERCGEDNPLDARFCMECGEPIGQGVTGPTVRLTGKECAACGASNPEQADFCVICGRPFEAPESGPAMGQHPRIDAPPPQPGASPRQRSGPTRGQVGLLALLGGLVFLLIGGRLLRVVPFALLLVLAILFVGGVAILLAIGANALWLLLLFIFAWSLGGCGRAHRRGWRHGCRRR